MRTRALVSLVAASLAAVQPALAQDSNASKQQAKVHYQNAEAAMAEGRFAGAAAEYIEAYELMKDPLLFYKIGVAYQSAGDCAKALVYFKRYVNEGKPTGDFEAKVTERIEQCAPKSASGPAAATTEAQPAPPPVEPTPASEPESSTEPAAAEPGLTDASSPSFLETKPSWQRSAGWVLMGGTIAFATAGTILAMSGASREEDLDSLAEFRDPQGNPATYEGNVRERYDDLVDEGDRFNTWSSIAFGAAGVCLVASVTLLVIDSKNGGGSESGTAITRRVTPVIGDGGGGIVATFGF